MSVRTVRVREFITASNSPSIDPLPLVHTTKYQFIFDIMQQMELSPTDCNVYIGEKILYCFVGRPAYKWSSTGEAKRWQLPISFVFERPSNIDFNRVVPFDSGSFSNLLPPYINGFPLENYLLDSDTNAIGKLVSVFFRSNERYFKGQAINVDEFGQQHSLLPRHQEVSALVELYNDKNFPGADDRKSTIEMQTKDSIPLQAGSLLGVVFPSDLQREPELISEISALGALVRFYDEYPLKVEHYTIAIYSAVREIMTACGRFK